MHNQIDEEIQGWVDEAQNYKEPPRKAELNTSASPWPEFQIAIERTGNISFLTLAEAELFNRYITGSRVSMGTRFVELAPTTGSFNFRRST